MSFLSDRILKKAYEINIARKVKGKHRSCHWQPLYLWFKAEIFKHGSAECETCQLCQDVSGEAVKEAKAGSIHGTCFKWDKQEVWEWWQQKTVKVLQEGQVSAGSGVILAQKQPPVDSQTFLPEFYRIFYLVLPIVHVSLSNALHIVHIIVTAILFVFVGMDYWYFLHLVQFQGLVSVVLDIWTHNGFWIHNIWGVIE